VGPTVKALGEKGDELLNVMSDKRRAHAGLERIPYRGVGAILDTRQRAVFVTRPGGVRRARGGKKGEVPARAHRSSDQLPPSTRGRKDDAHPDSSAEGVLELVGRRGRGCIG